MVSDVMVGRRSKTWEYVSLFAAMVAGVAIVIAYWQHEQVLQLSAQLAQQSTVIRAEAKPDLPLTVGFRKAILGTGLVLELLNNSGSQLEVAAAFTSEATGLTNQRNMVLPPNIVMQFGSREGWAFVPGQHIAFRNANFRPAEYVVP